MKYFIHNLGEGQGVMVYSAAAKPDNVSADVSVVASSEVEAVRRWMAESFNRQIVVRSSSPERFGVWHVDYRLK
jgi:hypothetical protein